MTTAEVSFLGCLLRPKTDSNHHPRDRIGVERSITSNAHMYTMPLDTGHAQIETDAMTSKKNILEASPGVFQPR